MTYIIWTTIIFLTFIIQGSVSIFDVTPNLTVVLAYYAGIRQKEVKGMFLGSMIGIVEDSLSGTFLGLNLLSKGLIGYFSSSVYRGVFMWTPLLGIISISALTLIDSTIIFLLRSTFDRMPVSIGAAVFIVAMQSLLNAPFGVLLRPRDAQ